MNRRRFASQDRGFLVGAKGKRYRNAIGELLKFIENKIPVWAVR